MLHLLLALLLSLAAAPDHATVARTSEVTIRMRVDSPSGAHVELLKDDAYTFVSGGIDHGACGFSGCLSAPGAATMTETIRLASDAPLGPLRLTALASTADGAVVTATVDLEVVVPDPHLSARWDSATSATIQWTQAGRSCLYKETALHERGFIGCYDKTGTIVLQLGHVGPIDGAYRPQSGDIYILVTNGQTERAPLIGRPQYLPTFR